jgi:hypothetical protein
VIKRDKAMTISPTAIAGGLVAAILICLLAPPVAGQAPGKLIALHPAGSGGIFDPSIADTKSGQRAWMSYSAVDPSPRWPNKNTRTITTRLAYSDDRGASWTDLGFVINGISEAATGNNAATWNNEASSIVFDPYAPARERWKLFWHHYLYINERGRFDNGWIAYKAAATPAELRDAQESKLLVGRDYNSANNDSDGATGSPVAGAPLVDLHLLHKDLNTCIAPGEPGAIAAESGIYLSISCYRPKAPGALAMLIGGAEPIVILLKCDAPCRPTSAGAWRYVATLLTPDDAQAVGADKYTASGLFAQDGKFYLIASPVSNNPLDGASNGCHIFRFSNIANGQLEGDGGRPTILKRVGDGSNSFNGACTYAQAVSVTGFVYGQIKVVTRRPYFQIFQSGQQIY